MYLFYTCHQRIILKLEITRIESDVAYMGQEGREGVGWNTQNNYLEYSKMKRISAF